MVRLSIGIFDLPPFSLSLLQRFIIGQFFHEFGHVLSERVCYYGTWHLWVLNCIVEQRRHDQFGVFTPCRLCHERGNFKQVINVRLLAAPLRR